MSNVKLVFFLFFFGLVYKEVLLYENLKVMGLKADRLERDRARRLNGVIFLVNVYVKKKLSYDYI